MAKKAKKADEQIISEAKERLSLCQEAWDEIYDAAKEDVRFKNGDQWPEKIRKKREAQGRPCLTINRLPQFIKQVVGDQRQNRPSIKVLPAEKGDMQVAFIREGLIRHIQHASNADAAYDMAFEQAVSGGIGFFRIRVDYINDCGFEQDIIIDRVTNPFNVYIDPAYTKADASDIDYGFILEWVRRDDFEAKWPGKKAASFSSESNSEPDWIRESEVLVCEYWRKVPDTAEILLLSDASVVDAKDLTEEVLLSMEEQGVTVVSSRKVKVKRVESYVLSCDDILESAPDYPGKYIPIIPVFGEEDYVDGKRILKSLIRYAKDPQRMYNYWRTAATEMVALAKAAPWIVEQRQIEGFEDQWDNIHTDARTYVTVNDGTGAPMRDQGAPIPAGFLNESRETADEMKSVIGIFDAGLGNQSNETSGRAILARQRESDTSTFAFTDNLGRSLNYGGRVVDDLIPYVYGSERITRVMGEDGETEQITINKQLPDGAKAFDITQGKYDIIIKTGPSYATQRTEAANSMMEFVQAFPAAGGLIGDLIAENMDWPGAEKIAERLKTMLPKQLQGEGAGLPPQVQQMVEQMQQAMQGMQAQLAEAQQKAQSEGEKLKIDAYKAETERLKVMRESMGPDAIQAIVVQTVRDLFTQQGADVPPAAGPLPPGQMQFEQPPPQQELIP